MNLPNKLTLLRVVLIPVFVVLLLLEGGQNDTLRIAALIVFCFASFTDFLDGQIARRNNLVTNFGKFMDPLADKLLVCSALICMIELGQLPSWYVITVSARELIISGFRLVAADNGFGIASSWWGKFKTTFQMLTVILLILNIPALHTVTLIIAGVAFVLTLVSLLDYIAKNYKVITEGGM